MAADTLSEKTLNEMSLDVRICQECKSTVFTKRDFAADIARRPADVRAYQSLVQFEQGIKNMMPRFQKLLTSLQFATPYYPHRACRRLRRIAEILINSRRPRCFLRPPKPARSSLTRSRNTMRHRSASYYCQAPPQLNSGFRRQYISPRRSSCTSTCYLLRHYRSCSNRSPLHPAGASAIRLATMQLTGQTNRPPRAR